MKPNFRKMISRIFAEARFAASCQDEAKKIPVLSYHRVLPEFSEDNEAVGNVSPGNFESQMAFLSENKFQSLSLGEFSQIIQGKKQFRQRYVLITLDDGYADNYHVALPIAQRYRIKINLFLLTKFIGKSNPLFLFPRSQEIRCHVDKYPYLWRPLSWEEARSMNNSGVGFGLHGYSHRKISLMECRLLEEDLCSAMETFQKHLGFCPKAYAIPYGNQKTYTRQNLALLRRLGLEMIFSTYYGRANVPCKQDLIARYSINAKDDLRTFRLKLYGAYDLVGTLRRYQHVVWDLLNNYKIS